MQVQFKTIMLTQKLKGFSIVELLVVIVVIGIIVGISTVAYNGMQTRARNVDTGVAVGEYIDALVLYHAKYGKYPTGNANFKTCLGVGYSGGVCWAGEVSENAAFTTSLKEVSSYSSPVLSNSSLALKGAWFYTADASTWITLTENGVARRENFVIYSIEGSSTKCPVGPVASTGPGGVDDGNIFTFFSDPPPSGQTSPAGGSNPAQCWVPLSLVK